MNPEYLDTQRALEFTKDAEQMLLMLKMFREALDQDVQLIQWSLELGNLDKAKELLHSLKGFAPVFCSDALVDHLVSVEAISKTGSCEEVTAAFASLEPKLKQLALESGEYLLLPGKT